jgi:phospholipid-transporting ATPase
VVPLALLIALKLLKDGYHDLKRHQGDRLINHRLFEVWVKTSWREVRCEDLRVGNYVLLREGSFAPADLLVVATGLSERICYIDTSRNLGNSDLTIKRAVKETVQRVSSLLLDKASRQLNSLNGMVKIGEPEADFNTLAATIKLPRSPKAVSLGAENLIARGSVVRIAPWVIGLVTYTGAETKLFLNSLESPVKRSTIERKVNTWVKYILAALLVLVICFALCSMFVSITEDSDTDFPRRFIVFCLLYNNIIPISLFVSLDLIRLVQVFLMVRDPDFAGEIDFNSADMNEDLGQVEYVFLEPGALTDSNPVIEVLIIGDEEYLKEVDDGLDAPVSSKNASRELKPEEYIQSTEANQQLLSDEAKTYLTSDQSPDPKSFEMLKRIGNENFDCFQGR